MAANATEFPYTLTITLPLPSTHLASSALRTLEVDTELSPFVQRHFELVAPSASSETETQKMEVEGEDKSVLKTMYRATTNRMLRVAVNGFMESLGVVLEVMQELDMDVLEMDQGHEE
ncbi:CTAG/PCC1 family protein [Aspergillus glaucus CBS 516.65]|uniref:Transcription factor Pcc1 n=1 Tax=Aspergillus glaucus CBS 516.65 TaxID=1160497 RepID=A0A1L9VU07_ASPGL|nr:hypothetical protein ASPGLDRAFT_43948 [Aspergillus glaucus CBS 516.65]OJJ87395.1 hypothetical protein ASPGLDRAFT_43948 [Aspergillus glaucus CBS 516.65]